MRWYETTSRILLIVSVVNFALAAPVTVAVRDIHEVRADLADVAKDRIGTSQSQTRGLDPWAQWSTTNAADRTSASPSPWDSEHREHEFAQLPPASPATSSVASNSVPSSPERPATPNSAPWSPDIQPLAGPHGWESPESPPAPSGANGWASPGSGYGSGYEYEAPVPHRGSSWNSEWDSDRMTLSQHGWVDEPENPATSQTLNDPPTHAPPTHAPPTHQPPLLSPALSTGPPPSADGRHPPSPGPDVNPPPSSELQRPAEHETESFLEMLLKGKVRRHISGPVAVRASQRELQDAIDPTTSIVRDLAKYSDSLATSASSSSVSLRSLPYRRRSRRKT